MLRKLVEYILIRLYLLGSRKPKDAIVALTDLLPILFACAVIMDVAKWLGPIRIPWYRKLWYKVKIYFRRTRFCLIGY